ncbi:hypothetical protein HZA45_00770 [Candidatus Peregrinibacteria bacterium]|nr:hypothetical protein [Candidatus Peregrinibacteria bacterium]
MYKFRIAAAALFLLAGCTQTLTLTPTVQHSQYSIRVEMPSTINAGDPVSLRVSIFSGGMLRDVYTDYRMLHVIIASEDLQDISHTNSPQPAGTGIFGVPHTFTRAGRYKIWAELGDVRIPNPHDQLADIIAHAAFTVGGTSVAGQDSLEYSQRSTIGDATIVIGPAVIHAGEKVPLTVAVHDAGDAPVSLLSPEGAYYAIVGDHLNYFRHGHLLTQKDRMSVTIPTVFPVAGSYGLWVDTFPIVGGRVQSRQGRFLMEVR